MRAAAINFGPIAILVLAACGAKMIDYTPSPSIPAADAKTVIHRTVEEQPLGFAPTQIVVSDEKLSFVLMSDRLMPGASNVLPVTFYFESLGEMDLALKRKGYQVRVFDSSDAYRFRVIVPSLDRARQFMDAMLVMSQAGD